MRAVSLLTLYQERIALAKRNSKWRRVEIVVICTLSRRAAPQVNVGARDANACAEVCTLPRRMLCMPSGFNGRGTHTHTHTFSQKSYFAP